MRSDSARSSRRAASRASVARPRPRSTSSSKRAPDWYRLPRCPSFASRRSPSRSMGTVPDPTSGSNTRWERTAPSSTRGSFETQTFRKMHGQEGGHTGVDDQLAARAMDNTGAWILGRNMFGPVRGPWPDESWRGWWGPSPPYHVPVFVLTHHARAPLVMEGGTTFHFVTGGIHEALERARAAAAERDVRVGGGVATIRQFMRERLVDELHLAITPVLLGRGESLFDGLDWRALRIPLHRDRSRGEGDARHHRERVDGGAGVAARPGGRVRLRSQGYAHPSDRPSRLRPGRPDSRTRDGPGSDLAASRHELPRRRSRARVRIHGRRGGLSLRLRLPPARSACPHPSAKGASALEAREARARDRARARAGSSSRLRGQACPQRVGRVLQSHDARARRAALPRVPSRAPERARSPRLRRHASVRRGPDPRTPAPPHPPRRLGARAGSRTNVAME